MPRNYSEAIQVVLNHAVMPVAELGGHLSMRKPSLEHRLQFFTRDGRPTGIGGDRGMKCRLLALAVKTKN